MCASEKALDILANPLPTGELARLTGENAKLQGVARIRRHARPVGNKRRSGPGQTKCSAVPDSRRVNRRDGRPGVELRQQGAARAAAAHLTRPEFAVVHLALVRGEEVVEFLIILRLHPEQRQEGTVTPAARAQAAPHQLSHVVAGNVGSQEQWVDVRPERAAALDQGFVQLVRDLPTALSEWYQRLGLANRARQGLR